MPFPRENFPPRPFNVWGFVAATSVTTAGAVLGLWWVAGGAWWLGLASLGCDALDGSVARSLGGSSRFGSDYDWHVDVGLATLLLAGAHPALLVPYLAGAGLARSRGWRVSGRSVLTFAALAAPYLFGRPW